MWPHGGTLWVTTRGDPNMGFSVWPHWDRTWGCAPPCSVGSVLPYVLTWLPQGIKVWLPQGHDKGPYIKEDLWLNFFSIKNVLFLPSRGWMFPPKLMYFIWYFSTGQNFPLPNEITILFEYLEPFWVQCGHILFWCVSDQIGPVHSMRWEEALRRRNRRGQKGVLRSFDFKS